MKKRGGRERDELKFRVNPGNEASNLLTRFLFPGSHSQVLVPRFLPIFLSVLQVKKRGGRERDELKFRVNPGKGRKGGG